MNHSKVEHGTFFDINLRYAQVRRLRHSRVLNTTGDNVRLRSFLSDYDVVNSLLQVFLRDQKARLKRKDYLSTRHYPHEVASAEVFRHFPSELILVLVNEFPHVLAKPRILLQSRLRIHKLDFSLEKLIDS